ncbi:hypothetical protein [Methanonatronarchaeum sp. AMET6-2]|uniref:hypothetical protein n=1 Tax=Methanonatronarchaeum sp. AMET6-2 TaxID=2933293 RepID=UPI0011F69918|nr:hypothetical protein [Methanonatronarchaeum sp. AMET6-2]RZN61884.1 MAG: hypothetical protein EF811_04070 [Methanonatronarchaeia archaeon]UOY10614.1 hypothetical protein MU439_02960 [Methanonatronarchaeum sp. AMET6-2]
MTDKYRFDLLSDTKTCYRYLQLGFLIIAVTFVLGIFVLFFPLYREAYDVMVMPALFLGLGVLLFGIGTHLHILHLNLVKNLENED